MDGTRGNTFDSGSSLTPARIVTWPIHGGDYRGRRLLCGGCEAPKAGGLIAGRSLRSSGRLKCHQCRCIARIRGRRNTCGVAHAMPALAAGQMPGECK